MATAKKANKTDKDLCRVITPEFRVSYPHVFKAQAVKPTDKPKFSITMLYPKDSDLMGQAPPVADGKGGYAPGPARSLKEVIKNAKLAEFGPKENWPEGLESPVTDGDDPKHKDKDGYKGHWVIKASTSEDQRPTVVGPDMKPINEPADLYPGCYARAYVYAYVWEYMGKQGVGFILDHVQKMRDGKSFGGKKPVDQVFNPISAPDDSGADAGDDDQDFK